MAIQRSIRETLGALLDGRSRQRALAWRGLWLQPDDVGALQRYDARRFANVPSAGGIAQFSEALQRLDPYLLDVPPEIERCRKVVHVPKAFDATNYRRAGGPPQVAALLAEVHADTSPGVDFYLHGSMASLDYTPCSDIDDLVIVRRDSWTSAVNFRRVAARMSKTASQFQIADPFQHHGHFVVTEFDMACYDESVMPLVVLQEAYAVRGPQHLEVFVRDSQAEVRQALWRTIQGMRRLALESQTNGLGPYWLKHLVGKIALIPPLMFQAQGTWIDKRSAIARSGELLDEHSRAAINWATEVRAQWSQWLPRVCLVPLRMMLERLTVPRHRAERLIAYITLRKRVERVVSLDMHTARNICHLADEAAMVLAYQASRGRA